MSKISNRKWLTCTPKRFIGTKRFFARDSGLLSEGFKMAGIPSQAIMLGPPMDDDDDRILRVDAESLEKKEFWESFDAEGVVLYAWALPQYTPIVQAIKDAGLLLVINLDSGGLLSPRVHQKDYTKLVFQKYRMEVGGLTGKIKAIASLAKAMVPSLMDKPRLTHMAYADLIGAVSPIARDRVRDYARHYGREEVAKKVHLILHPISHDMTYAGGEKKKQICIVGRWTRDDWVKNPWLLIETLGIVLSEHAAYDCMIIGAYDHLLTDLMKNLPNNVRARIHLCGLLPNAEAARVLQESQMALCSSFSEGYHTSSAEALCSGCSVVGYESPYLPNLPYYASEQSGSIAEEGTAKAMSAAISLEIAAWNAGQRNPSRISELWSERLHAENIPARIFELLHQSNKLGNQDD